VTAQLLVAGWPIPLAILVGVALGTGLGIVNGLLVTRAKLPPFIATLGMLGIARGIVLVITDAKTVQPLPKSFEKIANGTVVGIPNLLIFAVIITVAIHFFAHWSRASISAALSPSSRATKVGPQPTMPFIPNEIIAPAVNTYIRVGVVRTRLPARTMSAIVDSMPLPNGVSSEWPARLRRAHRQMSSVRPSPTVAPSAAVSSFESAP